MDMQTTLQTHELAMHLPPMREEEYESLQSDIQANGQIEPILTYEGKILDGRHRYRACRELRIDPVVAPWNGVGDPLVFVLSKNMHRRHLTSSQRAITAAMIEPLLAKQAKERQRAAGGSKKALVEGAPQASQSGTKGRARDQAARLSGTNSHYVTDAKKLYSAAPDLATKVWEGKLRLPEVMAQLQAREQPSEKVEASKNRHKAPAISVEIPTEPNTLEKAAATRTLKKSTLASIPNPDDSEQWAIEAGEPNSAPPASSSPGEYEANGEDNFDDLLQGMKTANSILSRNEDLLRTQSLNLNLNNRKALSRVLEDAQHRVSRMMAALQTHPTCAATPSEN